MTPSKLVTRDVVLDSTEVVGIKAGTPKPSKPHGSEEVLVLEVVSKVKVGSQMAVEVRPDSFM